MASTAPQPRESHDTDSQEPRRSTDALLTEHDLTTTFDAENGHTSLKRIASGKRWLMVAAPSILLCVFTIDFDLVFLSTNYSKRIASDLHQLSNAVWIILVGSITETASQPIYAYMGSSYGRRPAFLIAATLTATGFLLCSLSTKLWHLTLSRFVVGSSCAGLPLLVMIMLNDAVPLRDFALWRSLLIFVQMAGDITGGPGGSAIAESFGWPTVFGAEAGAMLCGLAISFCTLHLPSNKTNHPRGSSFDFVKPLLLLVTISLPLFALNLGGEILPWSHPVVITLFACTPVSLGIFYFVETLTASSPLVPVELVKEPAIIALMACAFFVVFALNTLSYNLTLYIETRSFDNPSDFGDWALSCIFFARPVGTLLSGLVIRRYREPWSMLRANMIVYFCLYFLVATGRIPVENPALAPYFLLIGLSIGVTESCLIVSLFSMVKKRDQPSCLALFNVAVALAGDVGVGVSLSLTDKFIRNGLREQLAGTPDCDKIISGAMESLATIRDLPPALQSKVIPIFVLSMEKVMVISCATLLIGVASTFFYWVTYHEGNDLMAAE
ncbi:major facilitator superfamily domain-containing protein [Pseudomassariella vexata]|uniref:Major facilitator superfamily domain-containing protein n=1 Tax=Pseudomassariella vexata TaxID=1141098 RepID=A0A1Y2E692_9PEZI|nr:major facilitator superfamily domain-containing protein [Pseudomassariella vexata]ORY67029.1 major facilitator superfamily domain-containing protein [Pseudomassariella vexata]